jgi:LmbE family N-acetylglucosaminyl deacetylase
MVMGKQAKQATAAAIFCGVLASVFIANGLRLDAQAPDPSTVSFNGPSSITLSLPEDRGADGLEQALRKLHTTASVMMIVAHPDDEDGALLTYLARGLGVRATLLTLNRGEGGQNVMSGDAYDALGIIRTNELLKADEYYGAKQLWGTEVDFGFSKTQEESFAQWGHERVLYDAVLAVRRERPQIIVSTFVGAVSDGHGQHQVSGEIAQEVFKAAGDPKVFPEQLKDGLQPWQPLAVYSRIPFAPITDKGMFDYATGHWAPARFKNYVTGEWINGALSTDATVHVGTRDAVLGRTYVQMARVGWGMQKSQNGGANPTLPEPATSGYHLWAVAPSAQATSGDASGGLFDNAKAHVDTSLAGLARIGASSAPSWLSEDLRKIEDGLQRFEQQRCGKSPDETAHLLAPLYRQSLDLRTRIENDATLSAEAKASLDLELDAKAGEFQDALKQLLGLELVAFRTDEERAQRGGFRGGSPDEMPDSVSPGEEFRVRVHTSHAAGDAQLSKVWLESQTGDPWKTANIGAAPNASAPDSDSFFSVQAAANAEPTKPFFSRPSIEQPYYDIANEAWRERSLAPWPLAAHAEFTFDGAPIDLSEVVQTLQRATGPGGFYEPLVVTPAIGVIVDPGARILPLDGSALPMSVVVHAQSASDGTVRLNLPPHWTAEPAEARFHLAGAANTDPIQFSVHPGGMTADAPGKLVSIQAVVESDGKTYDSGWRSVGYPGLRPYNLYTPAQLNTRKIDVKLAPGLRIGYVMGPGDLVPDAIQAMGAIPHLLSDADLASGDLAQWNVIVIGIRAYSTRPALTAAQPRLNEFVRNGGTLVVQYQSSNFPAPLPLALGRIAERVVDEDAPVKLLDPANSLLTTPNKITAADFNGWVEERGHSFMDTWDPGFTPLTETADPGQSPQRGGLLVAHPGKGTYIYAAYAVYRQLPELVPGAYRLLANLLSAGTAATH